MKRFLLLLTLMLSGLAAFAQQHDCATDHLHRQKMETDPNYAKKAREFDGRYAQLQQAGTGDPQKSNNSLPTYVIPVVVHVMHKGEAIGQGNNLSDEVIRAKIKAINEDYRNTAMDNPGGVDVGIEFALAVRDPQGQCTTGITRTDMTGNTAYMSSGVKRELAYGISDTELKALDYWDSSQYYNIWIVSNIDLNILGYAYYASAHGETYDGAVITSGAFSSPANITATHELGHAFNLYHTFEGDLGGTICPPVNGCGNDQGDCVADTAAHRLGAEDCQTATQNTCYPSNTDINYLYNFMNYSGCQDMFTAGQRTRMHAAISTYRSSYLQQNGNMSLVPPVLQDPQFSVSPVLICQPGQPITFTEFTPCIPRTYMDETSWQGLNFTWTITNGTSTATLTTQNAVFTPTVAGTYEVSLTITQGNYSVVSILQNAFIVTGQTPAVACTPLVGQSGNYAYTINNVTFNAINNTTSEIINGDYQNLTCTYNTTVTAGSTYPLSLRVRANNNNNEHYRVYIDYNGNGSFESSELVMSGINASGTTNTVTTNITIPDTAVQGQLLTMRVIGEAGTLTDAEVSCNATYFICDIEDYGIYIQPLLGAETFDKESFTVSPNPAQTVVTLSATAEIQDVILYNMLGQKVLSQTLNATQAPVNIAALNAGAYIIQATVNGKTVTQKLLKN